MVSLDTAETAQVKKRAEKKVKEPGKVLKIGIGDAINSALTNNFDIIISRSEPLIAEKNLGLAESEFDLSLFGSVNRTLSITPSASAFASPAVGEVSSDSVSLGFRQKLPPGTVYQLSLETVTSETNSAFSGLNPVYDSYLQLSISQPLLKGMGWNINTTNVFIAKNTKKINENMYKMNVMRTLTATCDAYWDMVYLLKELEVQKESLERAEDFLRRIELQVEVGVLAPIEIVAAKAFVAVREESLIGIRHMINNNQDRLKALTNFENARPGSAVNLAPVDEPKYKPVKLDVEALKDAAYANRPDYAQAKLFLSSKERLLKYNRNQLLPKVELQGTVKLKGLRGDAQPVTGFDGTLTQSSFGGTASDSLDDMSSGEYYDYSVGVVAEIPLFNRTGRNLAAKSQIEYSASRTSLMNVKQSITLEVLKSVRDVDTAEQRILATRASRKLAKQKLEAETKKYEVGSSTSFAVLEYQKDLTVEAGKEVKAVIDHIKALSHLELATGTVLKKNGIVLEFAAE
jgi:HAE1 family hydrophobic/amphiphilic exporter-1